jgi:hypothetical protein
LLALLIAGCGAGAGGNAGQASANGAETAEAKQERPIPCGVQAHGMGAVERSLRAQPERAPCDDSVNPQTMPLDALIRIIPSQHPSSYYVLAARLFEANRKDEAVFWFYAGQLRYRIRLACHPDLAPDTEPALFASLQETVGRQINEYAGGDPDAWVAAMQRALEWDERTPNGFEPKQPCAAAIADQRGGMGGLIDHVRSTKDQIRAERASRGLPNR